MNIINALTCLDPCAGDPPVPGDYEHLKIQDVGMRSVYSGLSPYVNTRQEADKAAGERDSVACHVTSGYKQDVATDIESLFVCWLGLLFLYTISSSLRYIIICEMKNYRPFLYVKS